MAVIEARGLRKAFGATIALDGVDLRVEEGRILGLIGPNGAGKTTALNAILGLTLYQRTESTRTRPVERARSAHVRCLVHCRCRRTAALGASFASAGPRCWRASAIRSREGGRLSGEDQDQGNRFWKRVSRRGHDRLGNGEAGIADLWRGGLEIYA